MREDEQRNRQTTLLSSEQDEQDRPEIESGEDSSGVEAEGAEPVFVEPFDPTKIQIQVKQDSLRNLMERRTGFPLEPRLRPSASGVKKNQEPPDFGNSEVFS